MASDPDASAPFSRKSYPPPKSRRKAKIRTPSPAVGVNGVPGSCMFLKAPTRNDRNSVRIVCSAPKLRTWLLTPGTNVLFEVASTSADNVNDGFFTGSGNDTVTTLGNFDRDYLETGAGNDRVVFLAGSDVARMGADFDTLVVDWSAATFG